MPGNKVSLALTSLVFLLCTRLSTSFMPTGIMQSLPNISEMQRCRHRSLPSRTTRYTFKFTQTPSDDQEQRDALSQSGPPSPSSGTETVQNLERWLGKEGDGIERIILPLGIVTILGITAALVSGVGVSLPSPTEASHAVEEFFADPSSKLEEVVRNVEAMGPNGLIYFGTVYTIIEILAIPAFALTASAGYLFGTVQGSAVVLLSASIAATISFVIGKTILRTYVEGVLEEYPQMQKIDKAIGKEGFKLMVLLRLSPFFPFALSNYLYGATSVRFWPYFWGTMIGFAPGTIAYVYTGEVGKALTIGGAETQPWYVYFCGFAFLSGFIKIAADVATGIIEDLEEEE